MAKSVWAPMPRAKRAKQFLPFDALTGLREVIAAKERITVPKRELTEDSIAEINRILTDLQKGQIITVIYYGSYEQDYLQITGPVTKVDPFWSSLQIGNVVFNFSEIYQICIESNPTSLLNT